MPVEGDRRIAARQRLEVRALRPVSEDFQPDPGKAGAAEGRYQDVEPLLAVETANGPDPANPACGRSDREEA